MKTYSNAKQRTVTLILFSLFLLMSLSYIASAEIVVNTYTPSRDFQLTSRSDSVNVCSCSTKYDVMTVSNTGTYSAIFTVSNNKEFDDKITIADRTFELQPGESRDVYIYFTGTCIDGKKDLTITVKSNLGTEKELSKKVTYERCQNLEMWASSNDTAQAVCRPFTFTLYIKNVGTFTENYRLASNLDRYVTYTSTDFALHPNQVAAVNATLKLPCEQYGTQEVVFTGYSMRNGLSTQIKYDINIRPDFNYEISVNNAPANATAQFIDVCNRIWQTEVPVTITNNGIDNNFTIRFNGLPRFASLKDISEDDLKNVQLRSGESKTFYILLDTHELREETDIHSFTISAESDIGDIKVEKTINLQLMKCYEFTINIVDDSYSSQKDAQDVCSERVYEHDIEIANNGLYAENIRLTLEGAPASARYSQNEIIVPAGETSTVKLIITGPEEDYWYNIHTIATLSNGIYEGDDMWINAYPKQECHNIIFKDSRFNINYQTEQVVVDVENRGIVPGTYRIDWDGTRIVDPAERRVGLNVSEKGQIVLDLDTEDVPEGFYNGTLTLEETESEAQYSQQIVLRLKDKSLFTKAFEYLFYGSSCRQVSLAQMVLVVLLILLIIYFIFRGPHYPYKFWNRVKYKRPIALILLVIFFVAVIFVVILAGLPKTPTQVYNLSTNESQLHFEWLENDKYTLDASRFFYDPDNSTLSYNVTPIDNIKTEIRGSFITFYPDLGFTGTRTTNIIAYDRLGASVESPDITLRVVPKVRLGFAETYNIYCWYSNLVIFLIILVLIFLAVIVKQRKRVRKK